MLIDEVLMMVEAGRVDPVSVDLRALLVEVREADDVVRWSEKLSKLIRLAKLKVRALVERVLRLDEERKTSILVPHPPLIPWVSLGDAEDVLRALLEVISRRRWVVEEREELAPEEREPVELRVVEEREHKEIVLRRVAELGRVRVEDLLEGDIQKKISIFVEILRLISEGFLRYDKATGEVSLERV